MVSLLKAPVGPAGPMKKFQSSHAKVIGVPKNAGQAGIIATLPQYRTTTRVTRAQSFGNSIFS